MLRAITQKKILLSALSRLIGRKRFILVDTFSFEIRILSALHHALGMFPLFQAKLISLHQKRNTPEYPIYNWYVTPFCDTDDVLSRFAICSSHLQYEGPMSIGSCDSIIGGMFGGLVVFSLLFLSEYISLPSLILTYSVFPSFQVKK